MLLHPVWTVAGLVVLALALWAGSLMMRTPEAKGAEAPAHVFAAGRALPIVERLLGDGTAHPVGSAANQAVRERLIAEFERAGFETTLQEEFVCRDVFASCASVTNVLARLDGREEGLAVLVAAHYDSGAAGPGASDDMAAVGAIVEVARMLRQEGPLRNPVIFLLTDGEEAGLLGAQAFVDHHPWARRVGAVVNLEARGSRGQSLLFEASGGTAWLIREFGRQAPRPVTSSMLYEIYQLLPNDTDFTVFREAGMAGINFAYVEGVAHYHTPLDNLEMMSHDSLQHHGDNLLAAVHAYGEADLRARPGGDALFIDLLPGTVGQLPIGLALPLGILCLLGWLVIAGVAIRTGASSFAAIAIGLLAVAFGVVMASVTAQGAADVLIDLAGGTAPWHAVPLPSRVAVWSAAAVGLLIPMLLLAGRAAFWGLTIGVWLLWAVIDVLLAALLPGTSVITIIPLLVATVALGIIGLSPARLKATTVALATLPALFAAAYIWLPTALTVELGLGFQMSAAIGLVFGLGVSAALPLLATRRTSGAASASSGTNVPIESGDAGARPGTSVATPLLALVAAAAVTGGAWAIRVPPLTAQWPDRMNIFHYQEVTEEAVGDQGMGDQAVGDQAVGDQAVGDQAVGDQLVGDRLASDRIADDRVTKQAAWLVEQSIRDELPLKMREAAEFSGATRPYLPWSDSEFFVAPAPPSAGPTPVVEIVADSLEAGERTVRVRLIADPELLLLELVVEGNVPLREVVFEGGETIAFGDPTESSRRIITCNGPSCADIEVALKLAGTDAFDLRLVEYVSGLPTAGDVLLAARPDTAVPSYDGDATITGTFLSVPEFGAD